MQLIQTNADIITQRDIWQHKGTKVGLVPTMGFLHEGHLSLVRTAQIENELVVVSIFVNPLQFGPKEDLSRYPRDLNRDLALLEKEGVSLVFNPSPEEIYPPGFDASVEIGGVSAPLEGVIRPGHFRGVATVVAKLFHLVGPSAAYFGQKDAQQVAVIKKMVRDLNFPLEIRVIPTVREPDGLALSSRNIFLSPQQRSSALILYRALQAAETTWRKYPTERKGSTLRQIMTEVIATEPEARPDYLSAADPETLQEYEGPIPAGKGVLLSLAVRFGTTRLIDNFLLEADG
ncbi:MAG: pantoate--beta-alanine ligase [Chloroflexota bacterium]|nr:pantoate--beta-alanine ligase [Chloroflexota bacterium]